MTRRVAYFLALTAALAAPRAYAGGDKIEGLKSLNQTLKQQLATKSQTAEQLRKTREQAAKHADELWSADVKALKKLVKQAQPTLAMTGDSIPIHVSELPESYYPGHQAGLWWDAGPAFTTKATHTLEINPHGLQVVERGTTRVAGASVDRPFAPRAVTTVKFRNLLQRIVEENKSIDDPFLAPSAEQELAAYRGKIDIAKITKDLQDYVNAKKTSATP
jgi:hypothetical protein